MHIDEPLEGRSFLDIVDKKMRGQWRKFGGPTGTVVTLNDIADLVVAHLIFTQTQKNAPEEHKAIIDMMRINPLASLEPHNINFDNAAVREFSLRWLSQEYTILRLRLIVDQKIASRPTIVQENKVFAELDVDPKETKRQIKACETAIKILKETSKAAEG